MAQRFIPSEVEGEGLIEAARLLKEANRSLAEAKKSSEAAKETLARWLKEKRGVQVEMLPIGELVIIEGVALIEIRRQLRFDEKGFQVAEAEVYARWKKEKAVVFVTPTV